MCVPVARETPVPLLARLRQRPADGAVWAEFVGFCGGQVYGWCRGWNLQEADALDVVQTVLLKLVRRLKDLSYDPTRPFRPWLRAVARNARHDQQVQSRRPGWRGDEAPLDRLEGFAGAVCVLPAEEPGDRELLEKAIRRVRRRVAGRTWEAFRLAALEGLSGREASSQTGLSAAQVYVARRRVIQLLREEARRCEGKEPLRVPTRGAAPKRGEEKGTGAPCSKAASGH
jgi:RNA polymerase sigma-70 factor (ECF subfamily)